MRRTIVLSLTVAMLALISTQAQAFHSDRSCTYCHVPHNAIGDGGADINEQVPLWNPDHSVTTLTGNYANANGSLNATMSAPNGASKTCLSCHDGTYAYVKYKNIHMFSGATNGSGGMGGIANTHPISFVYDAGVAAADGELVDPSTLASDILDGLGQMQCTSCHDIHSSAFPNPTGLDPNQVPAVDAAGNPIYVMIDDPANPGTLIPATDAAGDPIQDEMDQLDDDGNPEYEVDPYLRWEYDHGNPGTEGDFCRNCHIK